jgi:hypothetical protein
MSRSPVQPPLRWWNLGVALAASGLLLGVLGVGGILAFIGIASIAYHGPAPAGTGGLVWFSIAACAASALLILAGLGSSLLGLRGGAWEDSAPRFVGTARTLGWVLLGLPFGAFALGLVLLAQAVVLQGSAADPASGSALARVLGVAFFVSQLGSALGLLTVPVGGWVLLRRIPKPAA